MCFLIRAVAGGGGGVVASGTQAEGSLLSPLFNKIKKIKPKHSAPKLKWKLQLKVRRNGKRNKYSKYCQTKQLMGHKEERERERERESIH